MEKNPSAGHSHKKYLSLGIIFKPPIEVSEIDQRDSTPAFP
jgi:hypothetical protein